MKTKEAIRELCRFGAVCVRQRGSHKIFRRADGHAFIVPYGGHHSDLDPAKVRDLKRFMEGGTTFAIKTISA